ncbi:MAG: signal peptidase I [Parcubacteria group bacterium Gr01-1014_8]|nr:MAG: signal peptidase I [Parcubacteria group bacterium Gr01-1014_8]
MSELFQNGREGNQENSGSDAALRHISSISLEPVQSSSGRGALFGYTVFALILALIIRFFIAAPYVVAGSSMEHNFNNWDYLITDRISYRFEEPQRGDVIVFHLPQEYSRTLIKRIIGLPGETVQVDSQGVRIQNAENTEGFYLDEPYLSLENIGGPMGTTVTLGSDQFFVLGDNRRVSSDSRTWGILPRENIVGRVLLRLFPISKLGVLPAEARYLEI